VRRVVAIAGAFVLAGCGATTTTLVTVTRTVTSAPPRACASIGESGTYLCDVPGATQRTTAFYVRRSGRFIGIGVRKPPGSRVGHWAAAYRSPDGKTLLAQWSAECEIPNAYFVAARGGTPRPVSSGHEESIAHGWTSDGRAIVEFPRGVCGGTASQPGLYLVSLDGKRELVAPQVRS
jgi:hypothetical protein